MSSFFNVWAIVASVVFSIMLGFMWYGPLFGKAWMKLSGITMPEQKPPLSVMLKPIILSCIGAVLMAGILSIVIAFYSLHFAESGRTPAFSVAFLLWLGFIVPAYLNFSGWEGKSWTLFFINTGYWFVFLLVSALFIVAF